MDTNSREVTKARSGLTAKQWTMLFFSFVLGLACVFTLDKTFLARDQASSNTVQAATAAP
ncbi:MAG TPA: hypothetical protein DEB39_04830 [Planctomycetaceae bacterium]|nr:hypothetical protein [Planctomycetaceae bacterium]